MHRLVSKFRGGGLFQWHPMHEIFAAIAALILVLFLLLVFIEEVH